MLEKNDLLTNMDINTNPEKYLYHYTNIDAAIQIILDNQLKINGLEGMNDPFESLSWSNSYSRLNCCEHINRVDIRKSILREFRFVSFCSAIKKNNGDINAWNCPALWAHYAGHNGICVVMDKEKIQEYTKAENVWFNKIKYKSPNEIVDINKKWQGESESDASLFIRDNIDDIFFCKQSNWEYEHEYRLLVKSGSKNTKKEFISLYGNTIKAIIFGYDYKNIKFGYKINYISELCREKNIAINFIEYTAGVLRLDCNPQMAGMINDKNETKSCKH